MSETTFAEQYQRVKNNINLAYNKIEEKGGTIPATLDSANLANAIDTISGSGSEGIAPDDISSLVVVSKDTKVAIKWSDPENTVIDGQTVSTWAGTILTYKIGSYPQNPEDGVKVLDNTTRNQYSSTPYQVTGLTNNTKYYFRLFPYSTEGAINIDGQNAFVATPVSIVLGNCTSIAIKTGDSSATITWTDPNDITENGITKCAWAGTQLRYNTGSYPTTTTGTLAVDSKVRNQYSSTGYKITGLVNDTVYYFQLFPYSDVGTYNTNSANRTTGTPAGYEIVTFADGTDDQIAAMLNAHYAGEIDIADYWAVGNTRKIHLNQVANPKGSGSVWPEQDITIVITAIKHHDLVTPINGIKKAAITCQTRECINNCTSAYGTDYHIYPNLTSTSLTDNQAWAGTSIISMRTWMNGTFLNTMMPTGIKNMIKTITHQRLTTHTSTTTTAVTDQIFLPSYSEIYGTASYSYYSLSGQTTEGTQWDYYKTASNRIKYGNNAGNANSTAQYWWEGSPSTYYDSSAGYYWCRVNTDGSASVSYGNFAGGFAPAFAL